jgi:hypothetical protein
LVCQELHARAHHQLARRRPGDTLSTTALVHEAYLKPTDSAHQTYEDRVHILGRGAMRLLSEYCLLLLGSAAIAHAESRTEVPRSAAGSADSTRNVCRLLKPEELSALMERPIVFASVVEAEPSYGTCEWSDTTGKAVLWLTAYWSGGKEQLAKWRSQAGADAQKEAVNGLGDAAYFSAKKESLVLQGDRLLKLRLEFMPRAEVKFAALASKLLSRM